MNPRGKLLTQALLLQGPRGRRALWTIMQLCMGNTNTVKSRWLHVGSGVHL